MRMVRQMLFEDLALNGFSSVKIENLTENASKMGVQLEANVDTGSIRQGNGILDASAHTRTQKERCCERPLKRIPYLKLDFLSRRQGAPDADNPHSANPGLEPHTPPVKRIPGGNPTCLK